MLFNSVKYLLFFPLVTSLYYITNHKYRWIILLAASYYFYMSWKPIYALLILLTTFLTYITALLMDKAPDTKIKKYYLILNLVVNLGILFIFKYFNFIGISFNGLFSNFGLSFNMPTLNLLLPVGISFYTFQALGYTIDVYRGDTKAEKHFGIFALFLAFFPQLVAGPIERSSNLLPQFYEKHEININNMKAGMILILWGFFKKIVIADNLAVFVNKVYNQPTNFTGIPLIVATVFFGFQIFCDFSAYSDIAIGSSRILGFSLMTNFKKPYSARNISDFWRRWHISLSTWFKDYVYIPLGGNRVSSLRWCFNQFIVFLLSGIWHGANWTFIIWGILHGFYMVTYILTEKLRNKIASFLGLDKHPWISSILGMVITFTFVNFAWIFFRANTLSDAIYITSHLFTNIIDSLNIKSIRQVLSLIEFSKFDFIVAFISVSFMEFIHLVQRDKSIDETINGKPLWIRWSFCYLILFAIILIGGYGYEETTQFIYFQF